MIHERYQRYDVRDKDMLQIYEDNQGIWRRTRYTRDAVLFQIEHDPSQPAQRGLYNNHIRDTRSVRDIRDINKI